MRNAAAGSEHPAIHKVNLDELNRFAAAGLVQMLDPQMGLFCHRMTKSPEGFVREGVSHRYTIMTLLGLQRLEASGIPSPVDLSAVTSRLLADHSWITGVGDLGLTLWFSALCCPERLEEICSALPVESALERFPDAREGRTMELAWFLAGLAHAAHAQPRTHLNLQSLAARTWSLLGRNQGDSGIFGHQSASGSLLGTLRGRIGSFADQVYPIYALANSTRVLESKDALAAASRCADAICRVQGPQGQWWWHYDARNGKVFQKYPVYSVHQEGMAPMALLALQDSSGQDYSGPVYKGLAWIFGANESSSDMRDPSKSVIWRCLHRDGWQMYGREFLDYLSARADVASGTDLRTLYECRPYELGWLLYAFAGQRLVDVL